MCLAVACRHTVVEGSSRNRVVVAVGIHKEEVGIHKEEGIHREEVDIHKGEDSNTAEEDIHRAAVDIHKGEGEAGNSMVAADCGMAQDGLCKASAAGLSRTVHPWAGSRAHSSILECGTD
ncbi:hypothetical protein IWW48_001574 [Coemansia sp. RSA 1200]|nr:hypothetical protein IWW48_001574 [Coemansia sp. RSA 1200]